VTPARAVLTGALFAIVAILLFLATYRPTVPTPEWNDIPPASPLAPVPMPDPPLVDIP
jgi:hypothetical protein